MLSSFPPWRYPHLFKLWQHWLNDGQGHQLDRWLETQFRQNKQFGKKDRNAYREVFFTAMRYLQLAHALEHAYQHGDTDWQHWDKQWQAKQNSLEPAAFWYWVLLRASIETPAPRELADGEARLQFFQAITVQWRSDDLLSAPHLLWQGYRPSWAEALQARQQQSQWNNTQLEQLIQQSNEPAPVCLRPQNCNANALAALLNAESIETEPTAFGLAVTGKLNVKLSQAYQQGKFELQDTASQALAAAVTLNSGDSLWDVCAGAGGKALAFANMAATSHILATDIRSNALKQLTQRKERAGFKNITVQQHDACQALAPDLIPNGGFDWIFIDAPCSAAGTWRRAADARWRMNDIDTLLSLQQAIFTNAASHLKVGGQLIYATCSWLVPENEAQIDGFLAEHPHYELIEQSCVGSPVINSDTMFYGRLKRLA